MSWAEIKKAINSDLSTPLNSQITSAKNSLDTLIGNVKDDIETAGKIKSVKSVQRGTVKGDTAVAKTVTISSVDTSKSIIIVNGGGYLSSGTIVYAVLTNATTITLSFKATLTIDWQVIEFY